MNSITSPQNERTLASQAKLGITMIDHNDRNVTISKSDKKMLFQTNAKKVFAL